MRILDFIVEKEIIIHLWKSWRSTSFPQILHGIYNTLYRDHLGRWYICSTSTTRSTWFFLEGYWCLYLGEPLKRYVEEYLEWIADE